MRWQQTSKWTTELTDDGFRHATTYALFVPVSKENTPSVVLNGKYKHFCYEWDGLEIDETCPEFAYCTCFDEEAQIKEIKRQLRQKERKESLSIRKGVDPRVHVDLIKNYEPLEAYCPNYSSSSHDAMRAFLESIGAWDDFFYESMYFGDYYLEWVDSDHERDSSGDHLIVWKRMIDAL